MYRYRVDWSVPGGGGGASLFYLDSVAASSQADRNNAVAAIRAFFDSMRTRAPSGVSWAFPGELATCNDSTGTVVGYSSVTAPSGVSAAGSGSYAAGVGCRIDWLTDGVLAGRRVKGRTFFVPMTASNFDSAGTIDGAALSSMQGYVNTLVSALQALPCVPLVFSRRAPGVYAITSGVIVDKDAILRSRRD
jgi:hypothetical protein